MKRILVAVDFSEPSRQALHTACELAQCFGAPLRVAHVLPTLQYGSEVAAMAPLRDPEDPELRRELHELVRSELEWMAPLPELSEVLLEGEESAEILAEAREWGASLVVVGSHGKSTFDRFM